jgi:Arc/MetJ family transcription regulator
MRTNIDIDDELMKQAMEATGARTKRATIEAALRKLVEVRAAESISQDAFRRQEESRQIAIRQGRLHEWYAELTGKRDAQKELTHADQR